MAFLETYDYSDNSGFISNTRQINWHIDRFRDTNEKIISAQTVEQKYEAAETRDLYSNEQQTNRGIFGRFIDALVGLFSDDRNSDQQLSSTAKTYYQLAIEENQNLRNQLSADTNAMVTALSNIKSEINDVENAIKANTTGDSANTESIVAKLEAIKNKIPNSYVTP